MCSAEHPILVFYYNVFVLVLFNSTATLEIPYGTGLRSIFYMYSIVRIILVQSNIRRYYFYFLSDQAHILLDHFNVLDELWGEISTGFDNI